MKILATADLHGNLPEIEECDLLLIAGDICPAHNHSPLYQAQWLREEMRPWLEEIPAKHVVACAGNHDFIWERNPSLAPPDLMKPVEAEGKTLRWHYLQDEGTEIEGLKIWGTPWQLPFFDWAFNAPEDQLELAFDLIPDDTDIIVAHGPPYGQGDRTPRGEYVGSKSMLKTIRRVKPKLMVCGHIHRAFGQYRLGDHPGATKVVNAAYVNEMYDPTNEPVVINL